jgi:glycosyltransferase involved in cell wall biosynthesis
VGDVDDMSKNIIEILSDETAFKAMKKNALQQALKFDIDNIVPQYEELYKKVLREK